MKKGQIKSPCKKKLYSNKNKPILIVGISSGKRSKFECAREDPTSIYYLKLALNAAEMAGAKTMLIDLRDLKIGVCKECYSTCPAQCRFNEKLNQCDCYYFKKDHMFVGDKIVPIETAYDMLSKEEFFKIYNDKWSFGERDDMWIVYKALMEADGVIFASSTQYYSRPPLLQTMLSRLCALDGGVEKLWGDGKNLKNSIRYSKDPKVEYKLRLFGKLCAFINCSKEGDSVTPNLMKACSMMGMKILPMGVATRVNWYKDKTHRSDAKNSKKDGYTLSIIEYIGKEIVEEIKKSQRSYGICSKIE